MDIRPRILTTGSASPKHIVVIPQEPRGARNSEQARTADAPDASRRVGEYLTTEVTEIWHGVHGKEAAGEDL